MKTPQPKQKSERSAWIDDSADTSNSICECGHKKINHFFSYNKQINDCCLKKNCPCEEFRPIQSPRTNPRLKDGESSMRVAVQRNLTEDKISDTQTQEDKHHIFRYGEVKGRMKTIFGFPNNPNDIEKFDKMCYQYWKRIPKVDIEIIKHRSLHQEEKDRVRDLINRSIGIGKQKWLEVGRKEMLAKCIEEIDEWKENETDDIDELKEALSRVGTK